MELNKSQWAVTIFTIAYLVGFILYFITIQNYEFIWYIFIMLALFTLLIFTIEKTKFDSDILWGLSIWGLFHMSGGGLFVQGDVLYNLQMIHLFDVGDTYVLKYDQLVHAFGFFVTALVAYHLLKSRVADSKTAMVYTLAALVSMGLGVVNEIVEFIATVTIESVNVGGYYNTSLDLIANTIGAFLAIFVMRKKESSEESIQ